MKVLFLNTVFKKGSTGRICSDICDVLEKKGHQGITVYGRGNPEKGHFMVSNSFNLMSYILHTRLTDKHSLIGNSEHKRIEKVINEYKPDIIHLHNIHGYYINILKLMPLLHKFTGPIFWTLHDCWSFTGHCAYFDHVGCSRWKEQCFNCMQKNQYPKSWLVDSSFNNYVTKREMFTNLNKLTIITPSIWLAGLVKESFLQKFPVLTINNGIDLNQFFPEKSSKTEEKFIILCVANVWTERKGVQYLYDLSKRLDDSYRIVVIGKRVKNESYSKIEFIERTDSISELRQWYSKADVYINPTLEDNFPTVNLEAQACGTPVITFNAGGSQETISSETGLVIDKGDVNALLNAITVIKNHGKEYYSDKCREFVIRKFNKLDRYNDYLELYDSALQKK